LSTSAKVSVVSNLVALAALALAWTGAPIGLLVGYEWHKLLHLTGVILFFGNMIVGPLWLVFAWSDTDRQHFGFAVRTLVAADIWLTMPGVQLTVWNGVHAAVARRGAGARRPDLAARDPCRAARAGVARARLRRWR